MNGDRFDVFGAFVTLVLVSSLASAFQSPTFDRSARAAFVALGGR